MDNRYQKDIMNVHIYAPSFGAPNFINWDKQTLMDMKSKLTPSQS